MAPQAPSVRFDDFAGARQRGLAGAGLREVLAASSLADVVAVLGAAEQAARDGAWVAGFIAYDAAPALDPGLVVPGPAGDLPLVWFAVFDAAAPVAAVAEPLGAAPSWTPLVAPAEHSRAVAAVKAAIADGHTYQVNLTVPFVADVARAADLYAQLVHAQRPGYGALVDTGSHLVASASPELFFSWEGGVLRCRPMKGTAPRGRWEAEDEAAARALASSPKDRAENVMIVDLIRNDLGRVCAYGSVRVEELFAVEAYPTVWQMTSRVSGETRPEVGFVDVVRALFPCGSVTGAPKQRTMEIIAGLERTARGAYCGAVGWLGPPEGRHRHVRARFGVAIRTAVVDLRSGAATFGAGGGIVWDSEPGAEWAEVEAKAAALTAPFAGFDLVETMLGGQHLERHLSRMGASAARFGIPFDRAAAAAAVAHAGGGRVRLVLRRDGTVDATSAAPPATAGEPVRLAIDAEPVTSDDHLLFHKTTRRAVYDERLARHPGADDVLLLNERDEVTESTIANVTYLLDGRWWTPPLDVGCLPGVGRALLVEDGTLGERVLRVDELPAVEALALVSSLRGWRPAVLVGAWLGR